MDQRAFIHQKSSVDQRSNRRGQLLFADAGQKAQSPKIDPQNGDVLVTNKCDGVEQGTVAAQADQEFDRFVQIGGLPERTDAGWQDKGRADFFQKRLIDHRLKPLADQFVKEALNAALLFIFYSPAIYRYFH